MNPLKKYKTKEKNFKMIHKKKTKSTLEWSIIEGDKLISHQIVHRIMPSLV